MITVGTEERKVRQYWGVFINYGPARKTQLLKSHRLTVKQDSQLTSKIKLAANDNYQHLIKPVESKIPSCMSLRHWPVCEVVRKAKK